MPTKEALDQHQMLPANEMCEPRRVAPESLSEDGITPQIETILNDRKNTGKVDSWSTLWCVLFPEDKDGAGIIPLPGEEAACPFQFVNEAQRVLICSNRVHPPC